MEQLRRILQKEDKSAEFMEVIVNKTIPFARKSGDSLQVGYQLQNMAMLMSNQSNYELADNYYKQALNTTSTISEKREERLDIFINAARNALFMQDQMRARNYLDSAKAHVQELPHSSTSIPAYYRTELTYFKHIGDSNQVSENYEKGIAAAKKLGNTYMLKDLSFELSRYYKDLGAYQKAKEYLLLSNNYEPYIRLQNRALFQKEMAKLECHLGNYRTAYNYMDSLIATKDAIYQRDNHQTTQLRTTISNSRKRKSNPSVGSQKQRTGVSDKPNTFVGNSLGSCSNRSFKSCVFLEKNR